MSRKQLSTTLKRNNVLTIDKPHPAQLLVYTNDKRFQLVIAGRRFGKTLLGTIISYRTLLKDGGKVAWFSPTHKMYNHIFRKMYEELLPFTTYSNIQDKIIFLNNGSSIQFWSAENYDSIRGQSYDTAILDEAAYYRSGEIWQAAIRPTLADRKGKAYFLTTPNGRNWVYELYLEGLRDKSEFQSWNFPSYVSPYFDIAEYEAAKVSMPERIFRQEYDAEFLINTGEVFKNIDQICSLPNLNINPQEGRYIFGIDFGRSEDSTVVTIFDKDKRQMVWLEVIQNMRYLEIMDKIVELYKIWNPINIVVESNAAGKVLVEQMEDLRLPIEPFVTTNRSKEMIIQSLALSFEKKKILCLHDPELMRQLQAFTISKTTSGLTKYAAPKGYHDDYVMSLALAHYALESSVVFGGGIPIL